MNYKELKDRLRMAVKNTDTNDDPEVNLGTYINEGYIDLAGRYPFHQTRRRVVFQTTAGVHKYELPCDLTVLRRVMDVANGRKLKKMGDRFLSNYLRGDYETVRPTHYIRYRNYIEVFPTPSEAYSLELFYDTIPCRLEADTDCPVLPASWHDGIWMRAKWYYYTDKGDIAQQTAALNTFTLWVSDKPSEIEEETVDLDSGVEVPSMGRGVPWATSRRFDDGGFDFRDGR